MFATACSDSLLLLLGQHTILKKFSSRYKLSHLTTWKVVKSVILRQTLTSIIGRGNMVGKSKGGFVIFNSENY